jgi:hypothetical protein
LDPLSFDEDGRSADSVGSDHAPGDEGLQIQNVSSLGIVQQHDQTCILRNSESGLYSLLSEAAAKESMSTDLRVRGLLTPAALDDYA